MSFYDEQWNHQKKINLRIGDYRIAKKKLIEINYNEQWTTKRVPETRKAGWEAAKVTGGWGGGGEVTCGAATLVDALVVAVAVGVDAANTFTGGGGGDVGEPVAVCVVGVARVGTATAFQSL